MILHTANYGGNLHQTAFYINQHYPDSVPYILVMECSRGTNTVVVYRYPHDVWVKLKAENKLP